MTNTKLMRNEMNNFELEKVSGGKIRESDVDRCKGLIALLDPSIKDTAQEIYDKLNSYENVFTFANYADWLMSRELIEEPELRKLMHEI